MAIHSLCVCCVALSQLMQDKFGETALITACANGHLDTAKLLVRQGAVVNFQRKVRLIITPYIAWNLVRNQIWRLWWSALQQTYWIIVVETFFVYGQKL